MCVCFIRLKYVGHVFLFSTRPSSFGRALGNPLIKCLNLLKTGNFLARWRTIRFQKWNLMYGVHFSVIIRMRTNLRTARNQDNSLRISSATSYSAVQHLAGALGLWVNITGRHLRSFSNALSNLCYNSTSCNPRVFPELMAMFGNVRGFTKIQWKWL
jgi:hypothetical protein